MALTLPFSARLSMQMPTVSALDLTCQMVAYAGKGCCNNNRYGQGLKENVWTVKVGLSFGVWLISRCEHVQKLTRSSVSKVPDLCLSSCSSKPTVKATARRTKKAMKAKPIKKPTSKPTKKPVSKPSKRPIAKPVAKPTNSPTRKPTNSPTLKPTKPSTGKPTIAPTSRFCDTCTGPPDSQCGYVLCDEVADTCTQIIYHPLVACDAANGPPSDASQNWCYLGSFCTERGTCEYEYQAAAPSCDMSDAEKALYAQGCIPDAFCRADGKGGTT